MIVVSNSSPLISLARIGQLNVLKSLFERILIPAEVHHEVTVDGRGLPGAEEVLRAGWIEVAVPSSSPELSLQHASRVLGAGERNAILLAKDFPSDLLLLDERHARRIAREANIAVTGCLGVLEAGARRGFVTDLRQAYIDLLHQGIRFNIGLLKVAHLT